MYIYIYTYTYIYLKSINLGASLGYNSDKLGCNSAKLMLYLGLSEKGRIAPKKNCDVNFGKTDGNS